MNYALVLISFDEKTYQNGYLRISQRFYESVLRFFDPIKSAQPDSIQLALGVYASSSFNLKKALDLKINRIVHSNQAIQLWFSVKGESEWTSQQVKNRVRYWMQKNLQWDGKDYLPMLCLLPPDSIGLPPSANIQALQDGIRALKQKSDWNAIYDLFAPVEKISEREDIWNSAALLSELAFACSKLSEISVIPPEIYRDEERKKQLLEEKKKYRKQCEQIFKRCLEISPENVTVLSGLAYFHYKNVQELTQRNGRRDGNLKSEADRALELLDKVLSINPARMADLYRKGHLFAQIMPNQILYGSFSSGDAENRLQAAESARMNGIQCFDEVIRLWEEERNDETKKRYRKEYIKSIYNAGKTYYDLIRNDWNEAMFLIDSCGNQPAANRYQQADLDNANRAWDYFYKCWQLDNISQKALTEKNLLETPSNGVEEGVHRLYWLGKTAFAQAWIRSHYGRSKTAERAQLSQKAIRFLEGALSLPYSSKAINQRKDFVVEMLARVLISENRPKEAAHLIRSKIRNIRDAYIQHTYALALILSGEYKQAEQILQQAKRNPSNRDPWTTDLLLGYNYIRLGQFDQAQEAFSDGLTKAEEHNKSRVEFLLIGQAWAAYLAQKEEKADQLLYQASLLDPTLPVDEIRQSWQSKSG